MGKKGKMSAQNFAPVASSVLDSEEIEEVVNYIMKKSGNVKKDTKFKSYSYATDKQYGEILKIYDETIRVPIYQGFNNIYGYSTAYTFNGMSKWPVTLMVGKWEEFKAFFEESFSASLDSLTSFIADFESKIEEIQASSYERIEQGKILLEDFTIYFKNGDEIIVGSGKDAFGGIIKNIDFINDWGFQGFKVTLAHINNVTGAVVDDERVAKVPSWYAKRDIENLEIRKITAKEKEYLASRGEIYRKITTDVYYGAYNGTIIQPSWWGAREYRADGRVMLDSRALQQYAPELYRSLNTVYGSSRRVRDEDTVDDRKNFVIEDDQLWRTSESIFGFSFHVKQWGRMLTSGFREIDWRADAFDKLVMDDDKKSMIKALVEHSAGTFEDIVEGKGGGCIFLLHGVPGTGKTLTAETVAELLKRPLYMISVGELGTEPDSLEERLRQILELATTWNAVLLLDEADIFLEERDEQNIVRNAMVGVFLRLLEYHQGVLFLTTNRVKNIDKAFMSRISVAIKFEDNDLRKRQKIWKNLVSSANVNLDEQSIHNLAAYDINGRQIKNTIRLAQTLAASEGVPVSIEHITKPLEMIQDFEKDLKI